MSHTVGETMPADEFVSAVVEAVRAARTGHGRFDEVGVDFTVRADGMDVRIAGLHEDEPDHEIRVVGDATYHRMTRYTHGPDGRPSTDERWVARLSADADALWLTLVGAQGDQTRIGTPLVLLEGVVTTVDPVVVARDLISTTYRCRILDSHLRPAVGDPAFQEGASSEVLVVLDADGQPIKIASTNGLTDIQFTGWRTTPEVTAPEEHALTAQQWYELLYAVPANSQTRDPH
jgi:hypothetical protein